MGDPTRARTPDQDTPEWVSYTPLLESKAMSASEKPEI
jgi:hypothetical protein